MNNRDDSDDTVEIPTLTQPALEDGEAETDEAEDLIAGLQSLSEPERIWLQWFYSLSDDDKRVVELCGEKGISVNAANFEQMKTIVKQHEA